MQALSGEPTAKQLEGWAIGVTSHLMPGFGTLTQQVAKSCEQQSAGDLMSHRFWSMSSKVPLCRPFLAAQSHCMAT